MTIKNNTPVEMFDVRDLTDRIVARQNQIDIAVDDTIALAVSQGEDLQLMKSQMGHGQWQQWLAENFPKHPSQARRYMQLAEGSKCARARGLDGARSIRQGLRLLAPPPEPGTSQPAAEGVQKANQPPEPTPINAELPSPKNGAEESIVANQPTHFEDRAESEIAMNFGTQIIEVDGTIMEERNHPTLEAAITAWRQSATKLKPGGGVRAILCRNAEDFSWTAVEKPDSKTFAGGCFSGPPWFDEILTAISDLSRSCGGKDASSWK